MAALSDQLDLRTQTSEEAETVLQQLALALTPNSAERSEKIMRLPKPKELPPETGQESQEELASRAQAMLRKAEARYRALVEQIPAVTFMAPLDGSTTELYVSPQIERLLGFSAREWLDNPILWYQQLHPDDQDRWQSEFASTLNAGEHFRSVYRFLSRDGRVVWIHGEAQVVADDLGRPLFLQGIAFDITELKQAEERLRQVNSHLALARDQALAASRAKSAFLANMSHELRTPLHAILGFTEILQEDARDGGHESFLPDLEKIAGSAKHLVGLIGNILDLSKIEAGKMQLVLEPFDFGVMVEEVVDTVLPLIEKTGNTLQLHCASALGLMTADATKVRQILLNLLSNAAKFTQNGAVTLQVSRVAAATATDEQMCIEVIDSGIGIEPSQMNKLFQSFSQVDDSSTRVYGGTGLGLAISQRFCQMMGGFISVCSEPGKGSTFTVHLPINVVVATPDAPKQPQPNIRVVPEPARDVPLVLVIDRDPQVLELMRCFLDREGLRVVTASSGMEGLRLAGELLPTAIALDVLLSDLDGWKVLSALKENPELADIPVVMFTLQGEDGRGYALGATEFLTRPIDWAQLFALLRKHGADRVPGKALIVDDEPANRELLGRMVLQQGWSVAEADNGWSALKCVAEAPPDLILLDLMMPEMDGFELVRLLRKTQSGRSIPVVVVTAKDLTEEERQHLNGCVQLILEKGSFSRDELLREIHGLVAQCRGYRPLAPPEPASQPVVEVQPGELADLQRQLEQAVAQRDAALDQLRHQPEWSMREQDLAQEAESLRQQLREQQQTVELLQSELDEAQEQIKELVESPGPIEGLHAEREALARLQQTEPPEWVARQQLERLRGTAGGGDSGAWRPGDGELDHSSSSSRMPPSEIGECPHRAGDVPPSAATRRTNVWYLVYQEEEGGKFHKLTASTEEIRQWVRRRDVDKLTNVHASRSKGGPFDPLTSYPEFRDLLIPPEALATFAAGAMTPVSPSLQVPPPEAQEGAGETEVAPPALASPCATAQMIEWGKMLLLVLLAVTLAMIAGRLLFRL